MLAVCGAALCENVEGSFLCLCASDLEEYDAQEGRCRPRGAGGEPCAPPSRCTHPPPPPLLAVWRTQCFRCSSCRAATTLQESLEALMPTGGEGAESSELRLSLGCYCSVAKSGVTLHDPMDCSTPGFPVPHHLSLGGTLSQTPGSSWVREAQELS